MSQLRVFKIAICFGVSWLYQISGNFLLPLIHRGFFVPQQIVAKTTFLLLLFCRIPSKLSRNSDLEWCVQRKDGSNKLDGNRWRPSEKEGGICVLSSTTHISVRCREDGCRHLGKGQAATREAPIRQKEKLLHPEGGLVAEQEHREVHTRP